MTNENEVKPENIPDTKDVSAEENQQQQDNKVDAKASQNQEPEIETNVQNLQEQLEVLKNKFAEQEKKAQLKAQNDQVKKLQAQVLEMSKKLEEQADMAASTRVDGASVASGTPIKTEINLNFRSSDMASWEKAAQQFLQNFQANQA